MEAKLEEPLRDSPEKFQPIMKINQYASTKTIASGMLDIALLAANVTHLKQVILIGKDRHPLYSLMVTLISVSICLQVSTGVCFLYVGSLNINKPKSQRSANILNNIITVKIFFITVINVIISSFGIEGDMIYANPHRIKANFTL